MAIFGEINSREEGKRVNGKKLMVLIASILSVALLALSGCGETPGGQTPGTVTVDKQYNALSPRGIQPAIEISSLAERLDSLVGKTVYVNQGEADPIIMPALYERLKEEYPDTNWVLIATSGFGPATPEPDVLENADAVIRGIAW